MVPLWDVKRVRDELVSKLDHHSRKLTLKLTVTMLRPAPGTFAVTVHMSLVGADGSVLWAKSLAGWSF